MTTKHRFNLEKGSNKHVCPNCQKKTFVLYIDANTGEFLPQQYGRCDRESKCLFHLNPYLDGYAKAIQEAEQGNSSESIRNWKPQQPIAIKPQPTPEPVFFDFNTFKQTLEPQRYEKNTFIQNLFHNVKFPFEVDEVTKVVQLYRLGTVASGYRTGANTFPFIDINQNVRAIQVKQFDQYNHATSTDFLHSIIEKHHKRNNQPLPVWLQAYIEQEKRVSCLFGEHLLSKYPSNPVALVEAPKTAVYCTLYFGFPDSPESLIWLAVYNKSSFSFDKLKVLNGRFVYVFPDLSENQNTFNEWQTKAKEYEKRLKGTHFVFSDLLEQLAPESDKSKGNDIADYLIEQDWRLFRKQLESSPKSEASEVSEAPKTKNILSVEPSPIVENHGFSYTIKMEANNSWSSDIAELEKFYSETQLPAEPVKLNSCSTVSNCLLFIESHFATVKANNGNNRFLPYLNRLRELKTVLTQNNY